MSLAEIDTDTLIETVEIYGLKGAAKIFGCSPSGVGYLMNKRGLERPGLNNPRAREMIRQAMLARYGYGNEDEAIAKLQALGKKLGRRPTLVDIKAHRGSVPSETALENRFGSFTAALEAAGFHKQKGRKKRPRQPTPPITERIYKHMTPKLRFAVLERDGFKCMYCGRSPKKHDVVLQVDHITPRSRGGLTTYHNLITSCLECNIGKGAGV